MATKTEIKTEAKTEMKVEAAPLKLYAKCRECDLYNILPNAEADFLCYNCDTVLPHPIKPKSDRSASIGFAWGAMFGLIIGGPLGSLVGGIAGGFLGKDARRFANT